MSGRSLLACAGVLAVLAACSAPKRAESPAAAMGAPADVAEPAPVAPVAPQSTPGATGTLQIDGWTDQFEHTLADLERLDCPNACRALGSLERSASTICGMTGSGSLVCQDVQRRRDDASGRVHERCGACP